MFATMGLTATVTVQKAGTQTVAGQNFDMSLSGLAPSDGTGGVLSVYARGDYEDENLTKRMGKSLSVRTEGYVLSMQLGSFHPDAPGIGIGGPFDFFRQIHRNTEVEFQRSFALSGDFLDLMLADATFKILLDLGIEVLTINAQSQVVVTLNYTAGPSQMKPVTPVTAEQTNASTVSPVPVPATLPLLLGGLAGLTVFSRRKGCSVAEHRV